MHSPLLRCALLATALLGTQAAWSQPLRCELNGEPVNPSNGSATAGKTGIMRCRTEAGALQREQELRNGKFIGKRILYGSEGRKEHLVNEQGNLDGTAREFYPDGKLREEATYANGDRVGLSKRYFPNGQLERIAFADPARERGAVIEYLEDGKLRRVQCAARSLMPEDRVPCGFGGAPSKLELYAGGRGQPRLDARASYRNGVLVERVELDDDGRPARSLSLKDGVETTRDYFPDGKPRLERSLGPAGGDRGRDGVEREWASNGQLIAERRLVAGAESGVTEWYMNGNLKQKRVVEAPGRDALVRVESYYDSGKLRARGATRAGRPVGRQESFDEAGVLRDDATYDERGILKTRRKFDETGKLSADEEYFEDGSRKLR